MCWCHREEEEEGGGGGDAGEEVRCEKGFFLWVDDALHEVTQRSEKKEAESQLPTTEEDPGSQKTQSSLRCRDDVKLRSSIKASVTDKVHRPQLKCDKPFLIIISTEIQVFVSEFEKI